MFKARDEQLKDFKKLIRITKKLITIVKERNSLKSSITQPGFEQKNPITSDKKRIQNKVTALEKTIEEYVEYIKSKAHDFNSLGLTQEEYKFCGCDDLSIFLIILIFKKEIKDINDREIDESILLDPDCKFFFRRRTFLYENVIREESLIDYPIFEQFDFESFAKSL